MERQAVAEEFVTSLLTQVGLNGGDVELLSCASPPPMLMGAGRATFARARLQRAFRWS